MVLRAWTLTAAALALAACTTEPAELEGRAIVVCAERCIDATDTVSMKKGAEFVPADADALAPPDGYVAMIPEARSGPAFGNAILLVDPNEEIVVPIFIGGTEALSIRLRLQKRRFTRPLTHDLMDDSLKSLGAVVLRAQVDALKEGVYIGSIVLKRKDGVLKLDARPSDAIALAIGNGVPIYVSRSVLDAAGIRANRLDEEKPRPTTDPVAL